MGGTLLSWLLHALLGGGERAREPVRRPERRPDELEAIEGIGPKIAAVLRSRKIETFEELANKTPQELRTILDEAGHRFDVVHHIDTWEPQARLLAQGRILEFMELVHKLRASVDPSKRS